MIVQCPQCSSQYRVQDDKIPASGGRISCPNCNNRFVVHPDDSQSQQGGYEEDATSVTDADQLQNRLAQMAEGMEGEDVDPADPGSVDPTEVMQGPNVPEFMHQEQGQEQARQQEEGEDGTREMRNPYAGDAEDSSGGDRTRDVNHEEMIADAVDDATEVWEGADGINAVQSENPSAADQSREGSPAQSAGTNDQPGGPPSPPPTPQSGGDGGQRGNSPPQGRQAAGRQSQQPSRQQGRGQRQSGSSPGGQQQGGAGSGQGGGGRKKTRQGLGVGQQPAGGHPRQQPGSGPSQQPGSGPRQQPGSGPSQQPGSGPSQQPGSGPRQQPGSDATQLPGSDAASQAGGPDDDHAGPWKLRGEHGLTYEFPETDALRNWLKDRDGLDDFELSADGGSSFHGLEEFPQVADLIGGEDTAGSQQISSPGQGGGRAAGGPSGGGGPGGGPSGGGLGGGPAGGGGPGGGRSNPSGGGGLGDGGGLGGGGSFDGGGGSNPSGGNKGGLGGPANQPPSPGLGGGGGMGADQSGGQPPSSGPSGGPNWDDALETGGAANAPKPVSNDGYQLPSRDAAWNKVLYGILVLLIILATGVFLEVAGIYPVGRYIPGVPTTFEPEGGEATGEGAVAGPDDGSPKKPKKTKGGESEDDGAADEKIKQIIAAAEESIENNRLQTAIEKLQAAKVLDPKRPRTYELLGDVYEKLGQQEKADKNHAKAEELENDQKGETVTQKGDEKKGNEKEDEKNDESPGESPN